MANPRNTANYLSAVIEVEWRGHIWVGRPSHSIENKTAGELLPEFLYSDSVVITAWNPNGEVCSADENARLNHLLESDLEKTGINFFECLGRDESAQHFEESFLALCSDRTQTQAVLDLARKYCQEAVFLIHKETRILCFIDSEEKEFRQVLHWEEA